MKVWMTAVLLVLTSIFPLVADNDKPITFEQLPTKAQQTINKGFADKQVAFVKAESEIVDKNYDVLFTDGTKVEFDRKGEWTEIDCGKDAVPATFVPNAISRYVKQHYPTAHITKIERDRRYYEIEISTGLEIKFDKKFKVVEIDR